MYIGERREPLWDYTVVDKEKTTATLSVNHPVMHEVVYLADAPWEGNKCAYPTVVKDGDIYSLYYGTGTGYRFNKERGKLDESDFKVCKLESRDGIRWTRPIIGKYGENNIVESHPTEPRSSLAVFLDDNPDCPPERRYKGIERVEDGCKVFTQGGALACFASGDGRIFERVEDVLREPGKFDSLNICFWDEETGKYRLYMRDYHQLDPAKALDCEFEKHVRDIQLCTSEDFVNWSDPTPLSYGDDPYEFQLYTNNIFRYPETDAFIGMPTRYVDRSVDKENFKYLPDLRGFRPMLIEKYGRSGTAITETMIMTSRDGQNFERTPEAFYSPGLENGENWVYGDGYFAYGMIETESDFEGEPNELSFYVIKGYRSRPANFERYTLRKDGFFSWRADFGGGEIVTKPFTFDGSELLLNFSTSALGYVRIEILDEDGSAIEGYDSGRIFGNSVARPCDFTSPISALAGKPIRFKITMRDADLYSFKFCK